MCLCSKWKRACWLWWWGPVCVWGLCVVRHSWLISAGHAPSPPPQARRGSVLTSGTTATWTMAAAAHRVTDSSAKPETKWWWRSSYTKVSQDTVTLNLSSHTWGEFIRAGIGNQFLLRSDKKWFNPLSSLPVIINDFLIDSSRDTKADGPYIDFSTPASLA